METYKRNYTLTACILSVVFALLFYFNDIVDGMFFSAIWGTIIAFALVFSVYCDKYINSENKQP